MWAGAGNQPLVDTIARVKPCIVGVGTVQKTRRPPNVLRGTGFVVADGLHVITNAHIIPEKPAEDQLEYVAVFAGQGKSGSIRPARTVAVDKEHDLCLLKINGPSLPAMDFGDDQKVREGQCTLLPVILWARSWGSMHQPVKELSLLLLRLSSPCIVAVRLTMK